MVNSLASFVITAFNAEDYISACVRSCLEQDYDPIEVVITDDGSNDLTLEILRSEFGNDRRVRILSHERNRGKVSGFNTSYMAARGKYVAIIGADDINYPDRVRRQIAALETHHVAMVSSDLDVIDAKGTLLQSGMVRCRFGFNDSFTYSFEDLISKPCVYGNTLLFRKDIGDLIFPLSNMLDHEDWWLPIMLTHAGGGLFIPERLICYRRHDSNTSGLHTSNLKKFLYVESREKGYYEMLLNFITGNKMEEFGQVSPETMRKLRVLQAKTLMSGARSILRRFILFMRALRYCNINDIAHLSMRLLPSFHYTISRFIQRSI